MHILFFCVLFHTTNHAKENYCFLITFKSGKNPIDAIKYIQSLGGVIKEEYKAIKGVCFCIETQENIKKIKEHYLVDNLEHNSDFITQNVQQIVPRHVNILKHYTNYLFNNYIFDNFIFKILPTTFLYHVFFSSYEYFYTGKNVDIFLLDTSIDINEKDIRGRAINLYPTARICNTHGTNVAVLAAGKKMGFAKESRIYCLNAVNCEGKVHLSEILKMLSFVHNKINRKSILLFGVSGPHSVILNKYIEEITKMGVYVIAPAGNDASSGCRFSPGSATSVLSVGASDKHGNMSTFTNYGDCVNIYSLGECIQFSANSGNEFEMQGTSVSAALVAGAAAVFYEKFPNATQEQTWRFFTLGGYRDSTGKWFQKIPYLSKEESSMSRYNLESVLYVKKSDSTVLLSLFLFVFIVVFGSLFYVFYKRKRRKIINERGASLIAEEIDRRD